MELTILIILFALLQFTFFTMRTGFTRDKYGVSAPKVVGNETWERIYRVQQNTMEQLVVFIPAIIIFSMHVSDKWVVIPGVAFLLGRQIYSHLYVKNPEKRALGMVLSIFSNVALVLGSLSMLIIDLFA
ncbi:MAPEG family protein [Thalassotalea nanhaiensis]|uniref:MAPEG family protein n=1 Tax=Thalassotalea nanhaiensis TaxID=3065648 RepID=A0ABY9THN9_9GAMM|nr:MAPEG family protein [Colwelliaceae bacterium SQ345]